MYLHYYYVLLCMYIIIIIIIIIIMYIFIIDQELFHGCYKDQLQRAMPHLAFQSDKLRIQDCAKACLIAGYTYIGAQV